MQKVGGSIFFTFGQKCLFTWLEFKTLTPSYFCWDNFWKFLPFINAHPKAFSHPKTIVIDFGKISSDRSTLMTIAAFNNIKENLNKSFNYSLFSIHSFICRDWHQKLLFIQKFDMFIN